MSGDPGADAASIRALVFDVFGTVVDWRSGVVRDGAALSASTGIAVDWPAFADAWRAGYQPAMQRVRAGERPWANLDTLHREVLETLLPRFGLGGLGETQRDDLNRVWHRLDPWPDALAGLRRLKARFTIAPLSNGNVALLVAMAKRARLPWDCVFSAEIVRKYKPEPATYGMGPELLGLLPEQVLMVAAHPGDLAAAAACGLRTAYVPRPLEHGPGGFVEPVGELQFDITARDFADLAAQLGA